METCRYLLVFGVILLGLCSTIIAEGTLEPHVNDKPIIDKGELDPTLNVNDPEDLDKLDKSDDVIQGTILSGNQVSDDTNGVQNVNEDTVDRKKETNGTNNFEESDGVEDSLTDKVQESENVQQTDESVIENADLNDKTNEENRNTDTEIENTENVVKDDINEGSSITDTEIENAVENDEDNSVLVSGSDVGNTESVNTGLDELDTDNDNGHVNLDEKDTKVENTENVVVKDEINEGSRNTDTEIENAVNEYIDLTDKHKDDESHTDAEIENDKDNSVIVSESDVGNTESVNTGLDELDTDNDNGHINLDEKDTKIENTENVVVKDEINEGSSNTDTDIENAVNEYIDLTDKHKVDDSHTDAEIENDKDNSVIVSGSDVGNTESVNAGLDELDTDNDNGHVNLDEKEVDVKMGNEDSPIGMKMGNEVSPITDNSHLIGYDENDEANKKSQIEGVDDGHTNLDNKKLGMETGNEAWFKDGESDSETTTVADTLGTSTSSLWSSDENENGNNETNDDYDSDDEDDEYDDDDDDDDDENIWADSKDDEDIWADSEDDDDDDEDIWADSKDDDDDEDIWGDDDSSSAEIEGESFNNNDDWWKKMGDMDEWLTTTESWSTSTGSDYEASDTMDDGNYDYALKEVDAGKSMMESPHHFDNNAGVLAGAKVFDNDKVLERSERSLYSWTMLLSLCLVVTIFFIFWNRRKVERYIVSLRRPMNGHARRIGDEEKNLLQNEYA